MEKWSESMGVIRNSIYWCGGLFPMVIRCGVCSFSMHQSLVSASCAPRG